MLTRTRLKRWLVFNLFVLFVEINLFHTYEQPQPFKSSISLNNAQPRPQRTALNSTSPYAKLGRGVVVGNELKTQAGANNEKANRKDVEQEQHMWSTTRVQPVNRRLYADYTTTTTTTTVTTTTTTTTSSTISNEYATAELDKVASDSLANNNMSASNTVETSFSHSLAYTVFTSIIYAMIIVATLIGNMLVILAVVIVRKLHTQDNANNFLIVSLAVSDLLVGLAVMPFSFYVELSDKNIWNLGEMTCDMYILSDVLLCTTSILNLVAISVDRYFIILHSFVYTQRRNAKLMLLMILVVWMVAALISIPPMLGWGRPSSYLIEPPHICRTSLDLNYQIYATMCAFYLPLMVMIVIYINIYRAARKIRKRELETAGHLSAQPSTLHMVNGSAGQSEPLMERCGGGRSKSKMSTSSAGSLPPLVATATGNCCVICRRTSSNDEAVNKNQQEYKQESKKHHSQDSDQASIESKLYHSSTSSGDSNHHTTSHRTSLSTAVRKDSTLHPPEHQKFHHHHHHHHYRHHQHHHHHHQQQQQQQNQYHQQQSQQSRSRGEKPFTLITQLSTTTSTDRPNLFGSKFGRRLTQAFAGLQSVVSHHPNGSGGHAQRNSGASIVHGGGKNQKATKTLGVIMGCFILCWLPFFILALVKPFRLNNGEIVGDKIPHWFDSMLLWLGYFNSALNPVIYARYNREFRRPFLEILCFRCRGINNKLRDEERRKMYMDVSSAHHSSFFMQSQQQQQTMILTPSSAVISSLAYSSATTSTAPATHTQQQEQQQPVLNEEETSSHKEEAGTARENAGGDGDDEKVAAERKKHIENERTRFYCGAEKRPPTYLTKESLETVESDLHTFVERLKSANEQRRQSTVSVIDDFASAGDVGGGGGGGGDGSCSGSDGAQIQTKSQNKCDENNNNTTTTLTPTPLINPTTTTTNNNSNNLIQKTFSFSSNQSSDYHQQQKVTDDQQSNRTPVKDDFYSVDGDSSSEHQHYSECTIQPIAATAQQPAASSSNESAAAAARNGLVFNRAAAAAAASSNRIEIAALKPFLIEDNDNYDDYHDDDNNDGGFASAHSLFTQIEHSVANKATARYYDMTTSSPSKTTMSSIKSPRRLKHSNGGGAVPPKVLANIMAAETSAATVATTSSSNDTSQVSSPSPSSTSSFYSGTAATSSFRTAPTSPALSCCSSTPASGNSPPVNAKLRDLSVEMRRLLIFQNDSISDENDSAAANWTSSSSSGGATTMTTGTYKKSEISRQRKLSSVKKKSFINQDNNNTETAETKSLTTMGQMTTPTTNALELASNTDETAIGRSTSISGSFSSTVDDPLHAATRKLKTKKVAYCTNLSLARASSPSKSSSPLLSSSSHGQRLANTKFHHQIELTSKPDQYPTAAAAAAAVATRTDSPRLVLLCTTSNTTSTSLIGNDDTTPSETSV